jgi:hypothetical protein
VGAERLVGGPGIRAGVCRVGVLIGAAAGSLAVSAGGAGTLSPFSEAAIARGVFYPVSLGAFQFGSGLGLFDLDADGDPDMLVLGASDGRVGLYENDGTGHFTDRTYDGASPRMATHFDYAGVSAADYDADGDLDVYLSRYGQANILYRNNGDWTFTDVTASSGLGDAGHSLSTVWADCNADGWLDLYVCNRTTTNNDLTENAFYENNGDGTFGEKAALLGIQRPGDPTLVAAFFDADLDSDPDLYLATDKGYAGPFMNHLFENTGGAFADVTAPSGAGIDVDGMGIGIGDIERDGDYDLYVTNLPAGHVLLTSNGDGTYTDSTAAAGMEAFAFGWGTMFFDFDNDGWEDVYVCHAANDRNQLFRNPGSFPLVEIAQSMNVGTTGNSYNVASADVDGDGDLDMIVNKLADRVQLYLNNEGEKRSWAMFDVVGRGGNLFAIGGRVEVLQSGEPPRMREVRAGHHYKAQDPTTVHFGMGDGVTTLDEIRVFWPNLGGTRVLTGYPAKERWTLYPPERLGDADLDGDVDSTDQQIAYDRFLANGGQPEPVSPGIEMLDVDGDGDFDSGDMDTIGIPCQADLAEPFGVLDLADISTFVAAFVALDPAADLTGDGLFDLTDLTAFVTSFLAGCP